MGFDKAIKIQNNRRAYAKVISKTFELHMTPRSCIIRYCMKEGVRFSSDALSFIEKEVKRILYARSLI